MGQLHLETMEFTPGMVVARGLPEVSEYFPKEQYDLIVAQLPDVCPIWGDKLPYKSVTIVCPQEQMEEVEYWIAYVHGGECIQKIKLMENGKAAIRSDYQCW